MKTIGFLLIALLCFSYGEVEAQKTYTVATAEELEFLFGKQQMGIVVELKPGQYDLIPMPMLDSSCGNCENPNTYVPVTVGLYISGMQIQIFGPPDHSATIVTHSGYGLFFDDCRDCQIKDLSITGGERDADGNATDAAVVVKNSDVIIDNCIIHDNIGDSALLADKIVGIMGICGRENSHLSVFSNRVIRNSWDGIALYRGADADIQFNVIDGVDEAGGNQAGGGRGVGIGVTWNAKARIEDNLVKRYWKGIGLFVDADAIVRENVVEDLLTWGISLWDADKGKPVGIIENNVIYNTGACGASITSTTADRDPGHFTGNVIVKTAQDPRYDSPDYYCYQCALAEHSVPEGFRIADNIFYNNRRATDDLPDHDISESDFRKAITPMCLWFSNHKIFKYSDFVKEICGNN
jgi:hypothetical protein